MKLLQLTSSDKKVILDWYETYRTDSSPGGGGGIVLPDEAQLVSRLMDCPDSEFVVSDSQIGLLHSWMMHSVGNRYGPARFVLPEEKTAYEKIDTLYRLLTDEEVGRKEAGLRLQTVNDHISRELGERKSRKERSLDEKIAAVNRMKMPPDPPFHPNETR